MTRVEALPLATDTDCPRLDSVQAEVRELTTPDQRRGVPADAKVLVSDRGESIAIAITKDGKTTVRVYHDPARDCARRAHFVSVLVVVALMPPDVGSDPEPLPEPEPSAPGPTASVQREPEPKPAPEPSPKPEPSPRRVRIELAARGDVGTPISDTVRVALPSGALAVALGSGDVRLTLGTGYAPRTQLRYTGVAAGSAELTRLDVALGARFVFVHTPVDGSADVSAVVTRSQVAGQSSRRPSEDTAFSAGARVGLHFCVSEQAPISPFLGVYATVFPFAPELSQLPQGSVGHLPYLWLGLSGGVALAL
jgi:hypothetical protein